VVLFGGLQRPFEASCCSMANDTHAKWLGAPSARSINPMAKIRDAITTFYEVLDIYETLFGKANRSILAADAGVHSSSSV